MKLRFLSKIILPAILGLVVINMLFIDYTFFVRKDNEKKPLVSLQKDSLPTPTPVLAQEIKPRWNIIDSCYPYSCVDLIRQATASSAIQDSSETSPVVSSGTREYYVPFGGGETKSDQYEDVPGLAVNIDSTKYGTLKKVTFEVSLHIPTGNGKMNVQLFNATDKHPVWFSEVSSALDSSVSKLMVSSPITLDSGEKLYKVQAKTSLKYQSVIDQARVHILAE